MLVREIIAMKIKPELLLEKLEKLESRLAKLEQRQMYLEDAMLSLEDLKALAEAEEALKKDLIRQRVVNKKILITPVKKEKILREVENLSKKISRKWPKGLTAIEMIKRERE